MSSSSVDSNSVLVASEATETSLSTTVDDTQFNAMQHDDPRAVVAGFLAAIKDGDSHTLQRLLTERSVQACQASAIEFRVPQSHPLAECRVLHAEYLPNDAKAAHVRCLWSDSAVRASTSEIIFVLRDEANGWRIAGMVLQRDSGADIFDLESSEELAILAGL